MYYSDKVTDEQLEKLEKRLSRTYNRAYVEMKETANEYFKKFEDRYYEEYEAYQNGAYTDAEFKAWYKTQIARGKGYENMSNKLASKMTNANLVASAYINDATPSVYSLNRDYERYRIDEAYGTDFHLTDEMTLRRMSNFDNHIEFKTTSVNKAKDYEWNRKQIHNALTAGIMQGKSIDRLAESYLTVMKRNKSSAIRNARTSFTSAQNAGRAETYYRATEMGITLTKEWIATEDKRTRDTHLHLNGERVQHDMPFSNGLMYPADPNGEPREVYNCRCTMRAILPNINDKPRKSFTEWLFNDEQITTEATKLPSFRKNEGENPYDYNFTSYGTLNRTLLFNNVEYINANRLENELSRKEIVSKISGVDRTQGSCVSQALAYVGNKAGYDVTDYRGGLSCDIFADRSSMYEISKYEGVVSYTQKNTNDLVAVKKLFSHMENGKEYILATGEHVSIVYKNEEKYYYLDAQKKLFNENELTESKLLTRFGCDKNRENAIESVLIDTKTLYNNSKFINLLGYINTKR